MRLDLNKVLDREGEAEVVTADVDLCDFSYRGVAPFRAPIALSAEARNHAGVVTLDCVYRYTLELSCDRCLTPFNVPCNQRHTHTVVRSLNTGHDDDYLVLPDGIVELDELAANDVLLELPAKFLCKDDCKGLCPVCGCDLNQSSCSCDTRQTDPRLAVLDDFFQKD